MEEQILVVVVLQIAVARCAPARHKVITLAKEAATVSQIYWRASFRLEMLNETIWLQ